MLLAEINQRLNLQRFFRGDGPQPSPLLLHRRNVYILPTKQGLFFSVVLGVMLIGSINYANSLGYLLTFLLGSLTVVAILHTYRNLLSLQLSLGPVQPVFCGDNLAIPIRVDVPFNRARFALEFSFPENPPVIHDIQPHKLQTVMLYKMAPRRGRHLVGRFMLTTRFPLGLFRAWAHIELDQTYLAYPRPANNAVLPKQALYKLHLSADQGHGADDFVGLRNYHHGDSLRHIHWKALAREQGLLTKQFGGDRSEELWLDWRQLQGLDAEARLSQLTRWVLEAERNQLDYGLWLPGTIIQPGRGAKHQHRCLQVLALHGLSE